MRIEWNEVGKRLIHNSFVSHPSVGQAILTVPFLVQACLSFHGITSTALGWPFNFQFSLTQMYLTYHCQFNNLFKKSYLTSLRMWIPPNPIPFWPLVINTKHLLLRNSNSTASARSAIYLFIYLTLFFKRFYLFIFRERKREGEREGEKHQCVVVFCATLHWGPGRKPRHHQARALTGNGTGDPLIRRPALNPLSHASQGRSAF